MSWAQSLYVFCSIVISTIVMRVGGVLILPIMINGIFRLAQDAENFNFLYFKQRQDGINTG